MTELTVVPDITDDHNEYLNLINTLEVTIDCMNPATAKWDEFIVTAQKAKALYEKLWSSSD